MAFSLIAICDVCGITSPVKDEGELPIGWMELIVKRSHESGSEPLVQIDTLECLSAYAQEELNRTRGEVHACNELTSKDCPTALSSTG